MTSAVADFYADRSILVTGFTGFIGKVLVEKLLRSVPRLKSVYLLIRPMKGLGAKERLAKVLESDLFDLVKKSSQPDIFEKLIAVDGDITEPNLGLSPDDVETICDQVSVVFHCAATIKFDEHMRLAVRMNIDGTKSLLELCLKMKHLDAFVHTSTAYSNCDREYIAERVYPSLVPWDKLIDSVEWMDDSMLERLTPLLIGSRPNSYTFTKAVTESMLIDDRQAHNRLPIVIVRPSIVTSTWREPKPGWVDNCNGITGLIVLTAKGLIKTLYGRVDEIHTDLVPADVVVNMLIVAGWHRGLGSSRLTPVIHCTTGQLNPVTRSQITDRALHNFTHKMPLADLYRMPSLRTTTWRLEHEIRSLLFHLLPAYVLDWAGVLIGRRGRMVKLYGKIMKVLDALRYFYTNQWDFQSEMAVLLNDQLSEIDREIFFIDVTQLDWNKYFDDYHWGLRKYVLKEDESNLQVAKRVHFRRRLLVMGVNFVLVFFIFRLLMVKTRLGRRVWSFLNSFRQTVKKLVH